MGIRVNKISLLLAMINLSVGCGWIRVRGLIVTLHSGRCMVTVVDVDNLDLQYGISGTINNATTKHK